MTVTIPSLAHILKHPHKTQITKPEDKAPVDSTEAPILREDSTKAIGSYIYQTLKGDFRVNFYRPLSIKMPCPFYLFPK